jgi:peroxiredoxin
MINRLFFVALTLIASACAVKEKHDVVSEAISENEVEKNDRPSMFVKLANGNRFNLHDLEEKSVLVLFHPDCDHCQHEAEQIEKNLTAFDGYQLYFVSADNMDLIAKFAADYKLINHPSIHFAQADPNDIYNHFGGIKTPSIYVYTKGGTLKKSFSGQTEVQEIINVL